MPRWFKFTLALFLIPIAIGETLAVFRVMGATGAVDTVWVPFLAGAASWLVAFLMLPKPIWVYVLGHEATHAVWTWIFGGRVKKFKVTGKGGHVITDRTNFVIALAPYFFPFYAILIVLLFTLGHLVLGWKSYLIWFHLMVGAAYSFHLTLTVHILKTRQSDITTHGYLFSGVIIWIGNAFVLLFGVPLLTERVGLLQAAAWWLQDTSRVLFWLSDKV